MDPTIILTALVTGATVALKETAADAVKTTYSALKSLIVDRFNISSVGVLEKDPTDEDFKKSVQKELALTPKLMEDREVLELIDGLYAAIAQHSTDQELESIGVDVRTIRSQRDTVIEGIAGFDKGLKAEEITSGQDTKISNITGKPTA